MVFALLFLPSHESQGFLKSYAPRENRRRAVIVSHSLSLPSPEKTNFTWKFLPLTLNDTELTKLSSVKRCVSFRAGDEKSLDGIPSGITHRVSETQETCEDTVLLLPEHNTQSVCSPGRCAFDARSEETRSRESTPCGRDRGNCYPNTMRKHDERAMPTTGKEPARACCTTWTSARNNTNHYDDGCSTAARADGYLIERGPV